MTIQGVNLNKNISFRAEEEELKSENITVSVKSDLVKSPKEDNFEKEKNTEKSEDKQLLGIIFASLISTLMLLYGGIVLKRKLSKPSFEEVQKCFKEIFNKNLSAEQIKDLISKYKKICKNKNTDEFIQKMINQLKKDYGIDGVKTELKITKLADNRISTALNQRERGNASPLAKIHIMPRTSGDHIVRSVQCETFATGFHEMKHLTQFSEAYRANPDKFAEVLFRHNVKPEEVEKNIKDSMQKHNTAELEQIKNQFNLQSEDDLYKFFKESVEENYIKSYRKQLDERYGKLTPYQKDSEEYKKGMEYIEAYEKYPDPEKNYEEYQKNLLEKEAWNIADMAKKIFRYTSSIWKL